MAAALPALSLDNDDDGGYLCCDFANNRSTIRRMMYCRLAFCAGWALNLFVDGLREKNIYFKGPPPPPLNNDGEIDDAEEGALPQKTELYDGRNDVSGLPLHI